MVSVIIMKIGSVYMEKKTLGLYVGLILSSVNCSVTSTTMMVRQQPQVPQVIDLNKQGLVKRLSEMKQQRIDNKYADKKRYAMYYLNEVSSIVSNAELLLRCFNGEWQHKAGQSLTVLQKATDKLQGIHHIIEVSKQTLKTMSRFCEEASHLQRRIIDIRNEICRSLSVVHDFFMQTEPSAWQQILTNENFASSILGARTPETVRIAVDHFSYSMRNRPLKGDENDMRLFKVFVATLALCYSDSPSTIKHVQTSAARILLARQRNLLFPNTCFYNCQIPCRACCSISDDHFNVPQDVSFNLRQIPYNTYARYFEHPLDDSDIEALEQRAASFPELPVYREIANFVCENGENCPSADEALCRLFMSTRQLESGAQDTRERITQQLSQIRKDAQEVLVRAPGAIALLIDKASDIWNSYEFYNNTPCIAHALCILFNMILLEPDVAKKIRQLDCWSTRLSEFAGHPEDFIRPELERFILPRLREQVTLNLIHVLKAFSAASQGSDVRYVVDPTNPIILDLLKTAKVSQAQSTITEQQEQQLDRFVRDFVKRLIEGAPIRRKLQILKEAKEQTELFEKNISRWKAELFAHSSRLVGNILMRLNPNIIMALGCRGTDRGSIIDALQRAMIDTAGFRNLVQTITVEIYKRQSIPHGRRAEEEKGHPEEGLVPEQLPDAGVTAVLSEVFDFAGSNDEFINFVYYVFGQENSDGVTELLRDLFGSDEPKDTLIRRLFGVVDQASYADPNNRAAVFSQFAQIYDALRFLAWCRGKKVRDDAIGFTHPGLNLLIIICEGLGKAHDLLRVMRECGINERGTEFGRFECTGDVIAFVAPHGWAADVNVIDNRKLRAAYNSVFFGPDRFRMRS
ncbi:MAG: hypothetical protein LBF72_02400 [Holosporales bacterium]|jgi:hypothetical protein|nr:hypothetical protein [Holosporales bacterium]